MARKGMDVFNAKGHLDKNDPGMPQLLRMLNKRKKEAPKKEEQPNDKMMNHLQDFVK